MQRLVRMTQLEKPFWQAQVRLAGVDEVGRGPLAGPVCAACVVMPATPLIGRVNDSKKVSPKVREQVYQEIMDVALAVAYAFIDVETIERINIRSATRLAMVRAIEQVQPEHVLIDAEDNLQINCPHQGIIKGDASSYTIAAASIVAKVMRDRYMADMHEIYPVYGFNSNKGYGTAQHIQALKEHGPCPEHRPSFIRNFV